MEYNWNRIKETLVKELEDTFNDPNQPIYPFSLEDGLDLFCKTLIFRTGERDLDGIESRLIPTLYKYYLLPKDKNDAFNYLTQIATKLDSYLQRIVFLCNPVRYTQLKSQNKGMYHYLTASGININNIEFRSPMSSASTSVLETNFGSQLYEAYELRNVEAHTANDYTDGEIPHLLKSSLTIYLFTTFHYYSQLTATVGHIIIPEYIKLDEIVKELTPSGEYDIDMSRVVGRGTDLVNLKEISIDFNKITVLKSIGGIGKTTLLKSYAKQNKNNYNHVIWIFNQSGLVRTFNNNLVLLQNLNFSLSPSISDYENYQLIMNAIKKLSGKTLLMIDDLKDDNFETYSQLPIWENCHILGTTRLNLTHSFINLVSVGFLDFESAKTLFCKFYDGEASDEIMEILFDYIGYHTLTIELLSKTLENNFTIRNVEELTQYLKDQSISNEGWQVDVESQYDNETITLKNHLLNAFKLISLTDLEERILCHFSIIPPLQFSGEELKRLFSIEDPQNGEFVNSLNSLVKKGWLTLSGKMFQMHAMIQEVIKTACRPTFQTNSPLIEGLCNYLDVSQYYSISSKIKYITCAQHLLTIILEENDQINVLDNLVAVGLCNKGDSKNALVYAEKALAYAKKNMDDHMAYQTYSTIGMIYRHLGNLEKSEASYDTAIAIIEEASPKYINALQVYLSYGTLLEQLGQKKHIDKAKELYEYALEELEFFLENNDKEKQYLILRATILNSIGKIYNLRDQYDQAIKFQKDAYEQLLSHLGSNHEIVAITANNLGLSYAYNKDFENSLEYHKIAVTIIKDIFDENHPEFSTTMSGLANAYRDAGDIEKAKSIFKEVLDIGKRNLTQNHPTMARRLSNYAALCTLETESELAKNLYLEAIKIDVLNYGEKYPNVATCHLNLGRLFLREKKWDLAHTHFVTAKEIYESNNIDNEFSNSVNDHLKDLNPFFFKTEKLD